MKGGDVMGYRSGAKMCGVWIAEDTVSLFLFLLPFLFPYYLFHSICQNVEGVAEPGTDQARSRRLSD